MSDYRAFLDAKRISDPPTGIAAPGELSPHLFPFQRDIVRWARVFYKTLFCNRLKLPRVKFE